MQKEQTHQQKLSDKENESIEYIPRKFLCQLIYRELQGIKGLAEGSMNKIKLTKRNMYRRSSFQLLKVELLLNKHYYKIN